MYLTWQWLVQLASHFYWMLSVLLPTQATQRTCWKVILFFSAFHCKEVSQQRTDEMVRMMTPLLLPLWLCCRAKCGLAAGRIWWKTRRGYETEVKASEQLPAGLGAGGRAKSGRGEEAVAWGISDCSFRRNGGSYVTLYQCGWASDELFYCSVPELHTRAFFFSCRSLLDEFLSPSRLRGPCWMADV